MSNHRNDLEYHTHGLTLRMQNPSHGYAYKRQDGKTAQDQRDKTVLYLDLGGKKIGQVDVRAKPKAFEQKVAEMAAKLVLDHAKEILDDALENRTPMTLETYRFLRLSDITLSEKLLGKANEYQALWDDVLCRRIGDISLHDPHILETINTAIDDLTKRKASHSALTHKEITYRHLIAGILRCAERDGFIPKGTARQLTSPTTETSYMLKALARSSLTKEETAALVRRYVKDDSELSRAALVRLLTGMTAYEICALTVKDVRQITFPTQQDKEPEIITYLVISKEHRGKYKSAPTVTSYPEDRWSLRALPCTEVLSLLLASQVSRHRADGIDVPLFQGNSGGYLNPKDLKKYEDNAIDAVQQVRLYTPNGPGRKNGRFDGDMPRASARYYLKHSGVMNDEEICAVLGYRRETTYGQYYVDWKHPYVMAMLVAKMERWHRELFVVRGNIVQLGNGAAHAMERIAVTAHSDGTCIISCKGGVTVGMDADTPIAG